MCRNFAIGVIAQRFGHSRAAAQAIVEILSSDELQRIEIACRRPRSSVEIAGIIMRARTRAASRLSDSHARDQALRAAAEEAAQHYAQIEREPLERLEPSARPRRRRCHGLCEVGTPHVPTPTDTEG